MRNLLDIDDRETKMLRKAERERILKDIAASLGCSKEDALDGFLKTVKAVDAQRKMEKEEK